MLTKQNMTLDLFKTFATQQGWRVEQQGRDWLAFQGEQLVARYWMLDNGVAMMRTVYIKAA